jgi:hypothetical protein
MKKSLVRLGLALTLTAAPGVLWLSGRDGAEAQGAPPNLNMVAYGDIPAANVGQWVVAIVTSDVGNLTCGSGKVISDKGSHYVTRVISDSAKQGCGSPGRPVSFYVTPDAPTSGGHLANEQLAWQQGAKGQNLTLGKAFTFRVQAPTVATDGVY